MKNKLNYFHSSLDEQKGAASLEELIMQNFFVWDSKTASTSPNDDNE